MSLPASQAFGRDLALAREVAPSSQPGPGVDSVLIVDYQLPHEVASRASPGPSPGPLPAGELTVAYPVGRWEVGPIEWYDEPPFELPPPGAETTQLDDSLETAMPLVTTGPVALVGTLGPSDQVDYFKLDGKEALYQLAFGNAQPSARGGQRIILLDRHGQTLHSLVMPSGKGVVTLDLRRIQPPGEPLYIGIVRDTEATAADDAPGIADTEAYWMFVRTPTREGGGSESSWYDLATEFSAQDSERAGWMSDRSSEAEEGTVQVTVAVDELVTASNGVGLATGPLPRLAAGLNRGLLAAGFDVGRVSPAEGLALDLPSDALEGSLSTAEGRVQPGPLVAVRGARLPLLAAASLGAPSPPAASAETGTIVEADAEVAADPEESGDEARPSRRLPAGLGLATVLAVSLLLPDLTGIRPAATLRRRLGLGNGGGVGPRP